MIQMNMMANPSWAPDWNVDLELSNLRLYFHPRVFKSKNHRKEPDPRIVGDRLYASAILCRQVIDVYQLPESKRSLPMEERLRCLLELIFGSSSWQADLDSNVWGGSGLSLTACITPSAIPVMILIGPSTLAKLNISSPGASIR